MPSLFLMKQSFLLFVCCLVFSSVYSQKKFVPDTTYTKQVGQAFNLQIKGQFKDAALAYDSAFLTSGGGAKPLDLYNAAFTWVFANNISRALDHLEKAVYEYGFDDVEKLQREGELVGLSKDSRWTKLLQTAKKNREQREAKLDKGLTAKLKRVYYDDQYLRLQMDSVQKKYGQDSKEMKELWKAMLHKDSLNKLIVTEIIDTKGWLGPDEIGEEGANTLFFVIQHADPATQEKYLPAFRKAVQEGNAKPQQLALLEDRTRVNKGQKQIYGSQVSFNPLTNKNEFEPIEDAINVNKRRALVGLGPLEEYAKLFGIEYKLPLKAD